MGNEAMTGIYLDHNATTPVDPLVLEAMLPYLREHFGNASSLHGFGEKARKAVEEAREKIAGVLGCASQEVIFTSGATESDNHALQGSFEALKHKGRHIVTSAIEHHAVLSTVKKLQKAGAEATLVAPNANGAIDPEAVAAALRDNTILVSVMYVNNETGAVSPIGEIGRRVKERGIQFHTDAVQAAGKLPLKVDDLNVDLLSLSGHKVYGPKGIGILYIRRGSFLRPLLYGGHHEFNRRAGTENVPAIVGLGRAFELAAERQIEDNRRVREMRDLLQQKLLAGIPHLHITGGGGERVANTLHILFHFVEGEGLILRLSLNHGIAVSSGSACTSGSLTSSHVLTAMGIPPQAANSGIRLSLGRFNTMEEMETVAAAVVREVERLRQMSPLFDAYQHGKMKPEDRAVIDRWTTV